MVLFLSTTTGQPLGYKTNKVLIISTLFSCRNMAFFAGALFAVLTIFTLLDKDVLFAEHVLTVIAILGALLRCKLLRSSSYCIVVL